MKETYQLKELYEYLRKFHLSESLYLTGAINAVLKYREAGGWHKENISPVIYNWLLRASPNLSGYKAISVYTTRLARFLILSGANGHRNGAPVLDVRNGTFEKALDMVQDLLEDDLEVKNGDTLDWDVFFGRQSVWQISLQTDRLFIIGRAYLLFIDIPSRMKLNYDIDAKMNEYFQMDAFGFMATGAALWMMSNGTLDYEMNVEIPDLKNIVTKQTQLKFLELSSGTVKDYRRAIRGEDWKTPNKLLDIYFLDPFNQMPAIAVERSDHFRRDSYVVPQAKFLLDRASLGMFYLLGDKERENAAKSNKALQNHFRNAFGEIYRTYVGEQLKMAKGNKFFIDLDYDFVPLPKAKLPDFAVIEGKTCILFEVKTTLLTVEARTFFDHQKLDAEVQKGSLNKAMEQLTVFGASVLNGQISDTRFQGVTKIIHALVGYEDIFVINSSLLPILDRHYGSAASNLQLATITDIDAIGNALDQDQPVFEWLEEKIGHRSYRAYAISTFINSKMAIENRLVRAAYKTFYAKTWHQTETKVKSNSTVFL
ncbi:hypothetical protein FHW88_002769 [Mucilaginibacter sp. SG538B]|uniref:hypothetical protein n=1 Tax=Mucilaginibacter sp. SG538B TaxID=2587021 RepID=UPI00159D2CFB|nr:hypothetical protein [Mucilaginibacter sp. SG538B]NVM64480.1 hypothetical protein [Mucilaginibacter sp. SG538B]